MNFMERNEQKAREMIEAPTQANVTRYGKKFKVAIRFTHKTITKIMTIEQVNELQADDRYNVIMGY